MKRYLLFCYYKIRMTLGRLLNWVGLGPASSIHYIGGSESLPSPLTPEEEADYLSRYTGKEEDIRQTLIERNLRLVAYIARKFENTGIGIEDLISIGAIGLIKAVNTYRSDKNTKLATYASRCIENEILMVLRKNAGQRSEDADREMLAQSIRRLTPREQQIITMRFGLGGRDELTQKEVADIMGISQSYISRLEKRIISRLKKEMTRSM